MVDLTVEDIINIHIEIEKRFPRMMKGIQQKNILDAIPDRPEQRFFNMTPFPDIYSKCASLLEAIIRWHTFYDGNKRTGLAAASAYMYNNNCRLVMPMSAVRFSVLIADKHMKVPFQQIVDWIKLHTAHTRQEYSDKYDLYVRTPAHEALEFLRSADEDRRNLGEAKITEWLAVDIYPEYAMEMNETLDFLIALSAKYPIDDF